MRGTWLAGSAESPVMGYPGRLRYFQAKWTLVEVEFKIVSETWDTPTYKLNWVDSFRKSTDYLRGFQGSNAFRSETGYILYRSVINVHVDLSIEYLGLVC